MLPKKYRLTGKKDFEKVFKFGQGRHAKILGIKFAKNNLGNSRFGFIVSKKVSPKAVVRNKIKRQAREIIQSNLSDIKNGLDVVIVCHPGITEKNYQEIEKEILGIAGEINLLN
ncbi:ribonuclease P protein component [bacterium]|nr:ribonuclease P protein component [bacterium]